MSGDGNSYSNDALHVTHDPTLTPYSTAAAYIVLVLVLLYHLLQHFDYSNLPSAKLLWNILMYIIPSRLNTILEVDQSPSGDESAQAARFNPQDHAAKSNSVRRLLGFENRRFMDLGLPKAKGAEVEDLTSASPARALPGLGNWDNSCYQNSVLQGLAALESLPAFLSSPEPEVAKTSTRAALRDLIAKLNDQGECGKTFWTPAILKNMSSWSQQDAQEYLSKVLDEVEKSTRRMTQKPSKSPGLESLAKLTPSSSQQPTPIVEGSPRPANTEWSSKISQLPGELRSMLFHNPLEGLLAQRVGCQKCGYVEGLSLVPFNCLTVPLGNGWLSDVRDCLDDYTALEPINGVECIKCTMLQAESQMMQILESLKPPDRVDTDEKSSPEKAALFHSVQDRLVMIRQSIQDKDFSDSQLKKCQIGPKNRVCTTKSRQAVIARGPKALVVHVNRSVFSELSGVQSKNYANVKFPITLSLSPWCLGDYRAVSGREDIAETWNTDPSVSMLSDSYDEETPPSAPVYQLRAVVTHYGRHENGHYICYRRSPHRPQLDSASDTASEKSHPWWRLSDEDVTEVTEGDVLSQSGVFMLFYEQVERTSKVCVESSGAVIASQEARIQSPRRPSLQVDEQSRSTAVDPPPTLLPEELPSLQTQVPSTPMHQPEPDQDTAQGEHSASTDTEALRPSGQVDVTGTPKVFSIRESSEPSALKPTDGRAPTPDSSVISSDGFLPIPPSTPLRLQEKEGAEWHETIIKARTGHISDDRFGPTLEAPAGFVSAN